MDYEQTEKDLKKITEIAVKLPEKYRKASFEVMLKLYYVEKSIAMESEMRRKTAG